MKFARSTFLVVILVAFSAGFWLGCNVDEGILTDGSKDWPCDSDDDCIDNYACQGDVCVHIGGANNGGNCIDEDDDGRGVGATRGECPACKTCSGDDCEDACAEDCDDSDPDVYPGAPEACDGKDNDCNPDTADGETDCESGSDCPDGDDDAGYRYICDNGTCKAQMNISICVGGGACDCNDDPLQCSGGSIEEVPSECR